MNSVKNLVVWQKAMDVAENIYKITQHYPKEEMYGIISQMRRAAVSIASNIAEGQGRNGNAEKCHFYSIANGSRTELETQLLLSERVGFVKHEEIEVLLNSLVEIGKMLYALQNKQFSDSCH